MVAPPGLTASANASRIPAVSARSAYRLAPSLALLLAACADDAPPAPAPDAAAPPDVATAAPPDVAPEVALPPGLVRALTITDVSVFQAVRVPLLADGAAVTSRALPVVAGRGAVVRVYVRPEAGFTPRGVDGELTVRRGDVGTVVRDRRSIARASRDESDGTVFQFALPAEAVGPDTRLSVRLLAPGGADVAAGVADGARFPAGGGEHPLRAQEDGGLDVMIVPLRWDVDGSGRLPVTDAEQIEDMRALLRAVYPVSEVRIAVHEPVAWTRGRLPSGSADFSSMLSALRALRIREEAPSGRYYYGMVRPTEYYDEYCEGACTLGQGYLSAGPADRSGKVAAGVGFAGARAAETFVHELGHNHGRAHAPCGGAAGPDLAVPYRGGTIGSWGFDERRRALVRPGAYDFMGYCEPRWVSDYSYAALWERVVAVNAAPDVISLGAPSASGAVARHRVLRLGGDAAPGWLDALDLPTVAAGAASLRWLDAGGAVVGRSVAQVDPLGDSDEAHALVPPPPPGAASVEVRYAGVTRRVALPPDW